MHGIKPDCNRSGLAYEKKYGERKRRLGGLPAGGGNRDDSDRGGTGCHLGAVKHPEYLSSWEGVCSFFCLSKQSLKGKQVENRRGRGGRAPGTKDNLSKKDLRETDAGAS